VRKAILDKTGRNTQQAVAGLLPEIFRQRAENSGKRGAQIVEANELNYFQKTLNQ
jgi:hypothetical protein